MINIEVGKEYITSNGKKVAIYAVHPCQHRSLHGAVLFDQGWLVKSWFNDGKYQERYNDQLDIVGPWISKPVVDWSIIPLWFNWVACDADSNWFAYSVEPEFNDGVWHLGNTCGGSYTMRYTQ